MRIVRGDRGTRRPVWTLGPLSPQPQSPSAQGGPASGPKPTGRTALSLEAATSPSCDAVGPDELEPVAARIPKSAPTLTGAPGGLRRVGRVVGETVTTRGEGGSRDLITIRIHDAAMRMPWRFGTRYLEALVAGAESPRSWKPEVTGPTPRTCDDRARGSATEGRSSTILMTV